MMLLHVQHCLCSRADTQNAPPASQILLVPSSGPLALQLAHVVVPYKRIHACTDCASAWRSAQRILSPVRSIGLPPDERRDFLVWDVFAVKAILQKLAPRSSSISVQLCYAMRSRAGREPGSSRPP